MGLGADASAGNVAAFQSKRPQLEGADSREGPPSARDLSAWKDPRRVREIVGLRDARSKTYELASGLLEWVGGDEVIHYKDASGSWQEIDNRIVSDGRRAGGVDYAYRNASNDHVVRLQGEAGGGRMVRVEHGGRSLAFGPVGVRGSSGTEGAHVDSSILSDLAEAEDCVTYTDVYPGVDLVYESTSTGVREYLVLSGPGAGNRFTFDLELDGVTAEESGGRIVFVDGAGETVFRLEAPLAVDEARAVTDDVVYALSGSGKHRRLTVTLSGEYLNDPARVFPVILDPDLSIGGTSTMDSYINTTTPGTVHPYNDPYLRTGYYSGGTGWRRSLVRFDLSGVGIPADSVEYCYILLEQCYGANVQLKGFPCMTPWSSASVTWNNQPYCDSAFATSGSYWNGAGWWWRLWTTTPVKKWLSGEWANYGWTIKDTREWSQSPESAAWLYSSDSASSHRPQLHIVYTAPPATTTTTAPPPLPLDTLLSYPAYTYSDTAADVSHLCDPLNMYFCDEMYGGSCGTADAVRDALETHTDMYDPIAASDQHVLFRAYGGERWVENDHQLADGFIHAVAGPRWHLRLFEDPYVSPAGHDEHENTVGGIHHEDLDHDIDMDWEDAERDHAMLWQRMHPSFVVLISQASHQNHPAGYINGWWSDGKMTVLKLYP